MNWFRLLEYLSFWRRTRITTKMVLGYLLVVCIPSIIITGLQYHQLDINILDQYAQNKQRLIDEADANTTANLNRIESVYRALQNNQALIYYLEGRYNNYADLIYTYNTLIDPALSFARSSSPFLEELRIYKRKPDVIPLYENTSDESDLQKLPQYDDILSLPLNKGLWIVQRGATETSPPRIYYYHALYNEYYTNRLGVVRLTVNHSLLASLADMTADAHTKIVFLDAGGKPLYEMANSKLPPSLLTKIAGLSARSRPATYILPGHRLIVNSAALPELGLKALILSPTDPVISQVRRKQLVLISIGLGALVCLSLFYYAVASSIARRIVRLAGHMKHVHEDNLMPYVNERHEDEIGSLVHSYNAMMSRINDLIHSVHEAQILQREAEIKMMQAQIKPHFIYNTLESMRMLARINKDREVEQMAYSLGTLMRYSLTVERNETTLEEEIANVEHYVAIQKIRMGDRLEFVIHRHDAVSTVDCPRFILQPLVENCIVHGFSNLPGVGRIEVTVDVEGAFVTIRIADNGNGVSEERLAYIRQHLLKKNGTASHEEKRSIGLYNVNERIKAYFTEQSGIEMTSVPGKGTICVMTLETGTRKELIS